MVHLNPSLLNQENFIIQWTDRNHLPIRACCFHVCTSLVYGVYASKKKKLHALIS